MGVHIKSIYIVNRDGSGLEKIIESGEDTEVSNPTWSPRGNQLIYNHQGRGSRQLFKATLDGGVSQNSSHTGVITSARIGSILRLLCRSRLSRSF